MRRERSLGATHKRKWNRSYEGRRIADVLRAREQASLRIVDLNVPGLFDDPHLAVRAGVDDFPIILLNAPRSVFGNWSSEHQ